VWSLAFCAVNGVVCYTTVFDRIIFASQSLCSVRRAQFATSAKAAMSQSKPIPIVIAGPSGVGKGTLIGRLLKEFPDRFGFSVSHTTRQPRPGEQDGREYHFTNLDKMKDEVDLGKFVEFANVHGNMYGTSKAAVESVLAQGKTCILDIDVQGCEQVKKSTLPAKFLIIVPPSMEELERRLRGRATETEASIQKRLYNAGKEIEYKDKTGFFDLVLLNDDFDKTYISFRDWILQQSTA